MKKLFRFIKEYRSTIGSVLVVLALAIACTATIVSKKMNKNTYLGRVISITPLYQEKAMVPNYSKIPYAALNIDGDMEFTEGIRENVGAYSDSKVLSEQQQKDKEALEALLASNTRNESAVDYKAEAQERRKKYTLNEIKDINNNTSVNITPNGTTASSSGSAQYANSSDGSYLGQFLLTAYCPCVKCCGKTNGITASGAHATANHTIAADSRYKFGTQMIINGQVYTVEDRGGAITGNHIDIFFDTHEEAIQFGTKYADVYLYTGSSTSTGSSGSVTLIGDSLSVGAKSYFQSLVPGATVDAVVGRQMSAGAGVVSTMKSSGTLGDTVIIELGTNGTFTTASGQALIDSIGSDKKIYWVNVYGPSVSWSGDANATIASLCSSNSNVTLIDWASVGQAHPEYFGSDGVHLTATGYSAYAQLMANSIK